MREQLTILVVDDDECLRRTVAMVLEDEGFLVEATGDGERAIELAKQTRPALAITDLRLPHLDGTGVAAALRAVYGDDLPVVLMSGSDGAAALARRIGAAGFLPKPFELDALLAAVRRCLPPVIAGRTSRPHLVWARVLREQTAQMREEIGAWRAIVAANKERAAQIRETTRALLAAVV